MERSTTSLLTLILYKQQQPLNFPVYSSSSGELTTKSQQPNPQSTALRGKKSPSTKPSLSKQLQFMIDREKSF